MRSVAAVLAVALLAAGCGAVDEVQDDTFGTESPEPSVAPAPYVGREDDPCDALPENLPRVSDVAAEADRDELAGALRGGKGVESVGLTECDGANVVIVGLSNPDVVFPVRGSHGTPVVTQRKGPFNAL